ncbi:MAG: dihydrolipoyl dehydrogenase [Bacillota bacterium]|nr:dihydrolipoyl dehydrogenase [Bacillota bacterium]MDW7684130.1 dihydrolipoyl dehydrogenase [Bacillota bacterium]
MRKFNLIVLGGGTAGMTVARAAAGHGWDVAVAESGFLGGSCINFGCIPTKTMIYSAKIMQHVREAQNYGILSQPPVVDWQKVIARKNSVVGEMRDGQYTAVKKNKQITLYEHEAAFSGPGSVSVGGEELSADKIVVATGARPAIPPVQGLDSTEFLTSTSALELQNLPATLVILGGGMIAVEFAQMFARFGVRVTIIQRNVRLAPKLEPEISELLREILESEGVTVVTGAEASKVWQEDGSVSVRATLNEDEKTYTAEKLMVALGRQPNTDRLALDKAGIVTDKRGYISVNDQFATSAPGVWALGDCLGGAMFTHKSWHDGFLLNRHFFKGEAISQTNQHIPYAVFTDPEIAAVGLGEQAAKEKGYTVEVRRYPFKYVGRARATGRRTGFVKLVVRKEDEKILGAHIIGESAGEIIHELVMAMRFGATTFDLQDMLHIHPTLAEGINSAGLAQ